MNKVAFAFLAATTVSSAGLAQKDLVIIDDGRPPVTANQSYSGKCASGHSYALDVSRGSNGKTILSARHEDKIEQIGAPTILAQASRSDLFAVRMSCGPGAASFDLEILQSNGQKNYPDNRDLRQEGSYSLPTAD